MKQVFIQDQKVEINSEVPTGVFCKKRFSKKIHKFLSKEPVLESLFNKFAGQA